MPSSWLKHCSGSRVRVPKNCMWGPFMSRLLRVFGGVQVSRYSGVLGVWAVVWKPGARSF